MRDHFDRRHSDHLPVQAPAPSNLWHPPSEQVFLDVAGVMFVALDSSGRVTLINKKGCEILGYDQAEIVGTNWFDGFIPVRRRSSVRAIFQALIEGEVERFEDAESWVIDADGEERLIRWHNAVLRDDDGRIVGTLSSGEDITERKRMRTHLDAEHRVTRVLSRSRSLKAAAPELIRALRESLDVQVGELWVKEDDRSSLRCVVVDAVEGMENVSRFRRETEQLRFSCGEGLIGHVWRSGMPAGIADLAGDDSFVRSWVATEVGLRSRFAFPILLEGELLGVMAFFTDRHLAPDPDLLATMESIGGEIGQFVQRKRAEEALKESEARARAILETSVDAILTVDEEGRIESFNLAAERLFGYTAREVVGRDVMLLLPDPHQSEDVDRLHAYFASAEKKYTGVGWEVYARRKDRSVFPVDLAVSEVRLETKRIFTALIRDISERRRLEREVLDISEHERQRIGRDLHDGLGSLLTGVAMGAQGLARAVNNGRPIRAEDLEQLAQMIEEGATQAQALSRGLNPVKLEKEGLAAALQELVAQSQHVAPVSCVFTYDESLPPLSSVVATQLYRIAQEAINNAIKHAHARSIQVRLTFEKDHLHLTVRDDGVGLPDDRSVLTEGTGLHIMPYRANLIGAAFDIRRAIKGGTVVSCRLPIT